MINLSINQILGLWTELEKAWHGSNSYAGDTAEIYAYRLMPNSPSQLIGDIETNAATAAAHRNAARSLIAVLSKFAADRDCTIFINDTYKVTAAHQTKKHPLYGLDHPLYHRWHVRVEKE